MGDGSSHLRPMHFLGSLFSFTPIFRMRFTLSVRQLKLSPIWRVYQSICVTVHTNRELTRGLTQTLMGVCGEGGSCNINLKAVLTRCDPGVVRQKNTTAVSSILPIPKRLQKHKSIPCRVVVSAAHVSSPTGVLVFFWGYQLGGVRRLDSEITRSQMDLDLPGKSTLLPRRLRFISLIFN